MRDYYQVGEFCFVVVNQAGTIFEVIENIAKNDPRNAEIFVLDNYAAFQDRLSSSCRSMSRNSEPEFTALGSSFSMSYLKAQLTSLNIWP